MERLALASKPLLLLRNQPCAAVDSLEAIASLSALSSAVNRHAYAHQSLHEPADGQLRIAQPPVHASPSGRLEHDDEEAVGLQARAASQYEASASTSTAPQPPHSSRYRSHAPRDRHADSRACTPSQAPTSLWALACLPCHQPASALFSLARAVSASDPSHALPQALPNSLWALAKIGCSAQHSARGISVSSRACDASEEGAAGVDLPSEIRNCRNASEMKALLDQHSTTINEWTLGIAIDALLKLHVDQRRATHPDTKEVKRQLSTLYMHLLPNMDPCRSVKLLQSLGHLGVCMHEPGQNQEGFTIVNMHMAQVAAPALLRMDNDQDIISMLWALSKHSHHRELAVAEELFHDMARYLQGKVPSLPFRLLSKVTQAYANVGINEWSLIDNICTSAFTKLSSGDFDPGSTTNMLDGLTKLKMENDSFVGLACQQIEKHIRFFKPGHVTTTAKALAEMRWDYESTWRKLMDQAARQMSVFTPAQVVSFTWSLSKRGISDMPMHTALATRAQNIITAARATPSLPSFSPSELASLVYLLGKQGLVPGALLPVLAEEAKKCVNSMALRHVSNMVRGFQLLGYGGEPQPESGNQQQQEGTSGDQELYLMAAQRAKEWLRDPEGRLVESVEGSTEVFLDDEMRRVERFKDVDTPDTFERIHYKSGNVVQKRLYSLHGKRYFISQNLSDICLALADRGVTEPELFGLIAARARESVRSFSLFSMVDLVCGLAQAGYYDKDTFDVLEAQFSVNFSEMGPQYLADTLWAFAVVNHPLKQPLLKAVMDAAWSRWQAISGDQQLLARLMWSLYTLNADQHHPDHFVLSEFKRLLEEQEAALGQGQTAAAGEGSEEPAK